MLKGDISGYCSGVCENSCLHGSIPLFSRLLSNSVGKGKSVLLQAWSGPEGSRKLRFPECKSVPLQAWSGPEGSRKLRFPDFMTTAQEGGKVVSLMHRPHLSPGNSSRTHFC